MTIKNLQFYKPNSSNKGSAVSISLNPKDMGVYVSFIKQYSWNGQSKTGSFKENKDNPAAKKNIKLNETEVSGLIRAIETNGKWSSFHKFNNEKGSSISFSPYLKDEQMLGFGLKVSDSKESSFSIGFTNDESIKLREWLKAALRQCFLNPTNETVTDSNNGTETDTAF
jgi:hypothetical protein